MKPYTAPLMNPVEGGSKFYRPDPPLENKYYEAYGKKERLYLLWMECKVLNRRGTYPCALDEGDGKPLFYTKGGKFASGDQNAKLTKRWVLLATPQNIHTDFEVTELSGGEFEKKFKEFQNGGSVFSVDEPAGVEE